MRTLYVLAGLLFCSAPAFAQGGKKPVSADHKAQAALPVGAALPGEEKLSAQERAERDFLMPVRRKQAEAIKVAAQEEAAAQVAATSAEMTARNFIGPEEAKPEEVAAAVAKPTTKSRTYHRRSSSPRRSSGSSARKHTTKKKTSSAKKKTATKRRR